MENEYPATTLVNSNPRKIRVASTSRHINLDQHITNYPAKVDHKYSVSLEEPIGHCNSCTLVDQLFQFGRPSLGSINLQPKIFGGS